MTQEMRRKTGTLKVKGQTQSYGGTEKEHRGGINLKINATKIISNKDSTNKGTQTDFSLKQQK